MAVAFGGALNMGVLLFMTTLITAAALSPDSIVLVPLRYGAAEVVAAIFLSVAALAFLPELCKALDVALARHYCRCHFLGASWRARRVAVALGMGSILISPVIVLGAYLLAALSPAGLAAFNVNAFGEALLEPGFFVFVGAPAAVYAYANALKTQGGHLAAFRRLYIHSRAGTDRELRLVAKSLFTEEEWKLVKGILRGNRIRLASRNEPNGTSIHDGLAASSASSPGKLPMARWRCAS